MIKPKKYKGAPADQRMHRCHLDFISIILRGLYSGSVKILSMILTLTIIKSRKIRHIMKKPKQILRIYMIHMTSVSKSSRGLLRLLLVTINQISQIHRWLVPPKLIVVNHKHLMPREQWYHHKEPTYHYQKVINRNSESKIRSPKQVVKKQKEMKIRTHKKRKLTQQRNQR